MYQIRIEKQVSKKIEKITDKNLQSKIIDAIEKLKDNPRPNNCKKLIDRNGYRIRVGVYRIIYTIFDDELLILIIKVGHRKEVY